MSQTMQRWPRWARGLALGVVTAVVGAVAVDVYHGVKSAAARIAASSGLAATLQLGTTLEVNPTSRDSGLHGFLIFGHTDYVVTYQITMTNFTDVANRRVTMQLTSKAGNLATVTFPPIVRAKRVGGKEQNEWKDYEHSTRTQSIVFELDLPSPGTQITVGVAVVSTRGFVADNDLKAQIMLPDGMVSGEGKQVVWK